LFGLTEALSSEEAMIDIVAALDLLDNCVRDRGADYRSRGRRGSADSRSGRYYTCPAATDSIVKLALIKAGAQHSAVDRLTNGSVADFYVSGPDSLNLTLGAVVAFRAAESKERLGHTWGLCLEAALHTASRFVELIPDGVVGRAAEADSVQIT
jgi:hypothetical protein